MNMMNNNNMMMNNNMMNNNMMMNNMMNNMMMNRMMNMFNNMNMMVNNMMNNNNNFQNPQENSNINNSYNPNKKEEPSLPTEDEMISLLFKRNDKKTKKENFRITIICKKTDLISEVIKRYCFKTNEKKENLLFLSNAKELDEKLTVEQSLLSSSSIILVIDTIKMRGGKSK
jgi:hypothetical protein